MSEDKLRDGDTATTRPAGRRPVLVAVWVAVGILVLGAIAWRISGGDDGETAGDVGTADTVAPAPEHLQATFLPPGFGFVAAVDALDPMSDSPASGVTTAGAIDGLPSVVYSDPDMRLAVVVQVAPDGVKDTDFPVVDPSSIEDVTVGGHGARLLPIFGDETGTMYALTWSQADGSAVVVLAGGVPLAMGMRVAQALAPVDDEAWQELLEREPERDGSGSYDTVASGYLVVSDDMTGPSIEVVLNRSTSVPDLPDQLQLGIWGADGSGQSITVDDWTELELDAVSFPPAYVVGVVTPDAAVVEVTTDNGDRFTLATGPPPELSLEGSIPFPKEFFVSELSPDATEVTVVVRDADGEEITRETTDVYEPMTGAELDELLEEIPED